jgi:hypothetical protein
VAAVIIVKATKAFDVRPNAHDIVTDAQLVAGCTAIGQT